MTGIDLAGQYAADAEVARARGHLDAAEADRQNSPPGNPGQPTPGAAPPDNTLAIVVNGVKISGWTETRVTRGLERVPADFEIALTEKYPAVPDEVVIKPGDPCVVTIGGDTVITGYVDRYVSSVAAGQHTVHIMGRSKVQDLIDCSAIWPDFQISGTDVADVMTKLGMPYGITVKLVGSPGPAIVQYNITLGDTPWQIGEPLARYAQKLIYDDETGALVLSELGTAKHASGFQQGLNVKRATVTLSMDQRYSEYYAYLFTTASLSDPANAGNQQGDPALDQGVPRRRRLVIIDSESNEQLQSLAELRAKWEMQRRRGRSQAVRVLCDSWRDTAGKLWTPNMLAPVEIPACKASGQVWLVSEVTYVRGREGTVADVVLMPPEAFTVEPSNLNTFDLNLNRAVRDGAADGNTRPAGPN